MLLIQFRSSVRAQIFHFADVSDRSTGNGGHPLSYIDAISFRQTDRTLVANQQPKVCALTLCSIVRIRTIAVLDPRRAAGSNKGSSSLPEAYRIDVRKRMSAIACASVGNVSKVKYLRFARCS